MCSRVPRMPCMSYVHTWVCLPQAIITSCSSRCWAAACSSWPCCCTSLETLSSSARCALLLSISVSMLFVGLATACAGQRTLLLLFPSAAVRWWAFPVAAAVHGSFAWVSCARWYCSAQPADCPCLAQPADCLCLCAAAWQVGKVVKRLLKTGALRQLAGILGAMVFVRYGALRSWPAAAGGSWLSTAMFPVQHCGSLSPCPPSCIWCVARCPTFSCPLCLLKPRPGAADQEHPGDDEGAGQLGEEQRVLHPARGAQLCPGAVTWSCDLELCVRVLHKWHEWVFAPANEPADEPLQPAGNSGCVCTQHRVLPCLPSLCRSCTSRLSSCSWWQPSPRWQRTSCHSS